MPAGEIWEWYFGNTSQNVQTLVTVVCRCLLKSAEDPGASLINVTVLSSSTSPPDKLQCPAHNDFNAAGTDQQLCKIAVTATNKS